MKTKSWVLLRGLARKAEHWGPFLKLLKSHSDQVLCLDLPGIGQNGQLPTPLQLEDYIEPLRDQWIEKQTQADNWGIIGISLGGMVSLKWLESHPDDFDSSVIINTSASEVASLTERFSLKAFKTLATQLFNKNLFEREKAILELTTEMTPITEALISQWVQIADKSPTPKEVIIKQLWAAKNFKLPKKLPIKPLFLASQNDQLASYSSSEKLAKRYHSPCEIHPLAGHDIPLDDPSWVINKISEHI